MGQRTRYRARPDRPVVAVQLRLETAGLTYRKWGSEQRCKAGDWLLDNRGDVYSVDAESFARTYRPVSTGTYVKIAPVWAELAVAGGSVVTKEGHTHYETGDWLVSNAEDGSDEYAIGASTFETLYEPDD